MADFNAHVPINALDYVDDDYLDSHIPLPNNVYSLGHGAKELN